MTISSSWSALATGTALALCSLGAPRLVQAQTPQQGPDSTAGATTPAMPTPEYGAQQSPPAATDTTPSVPSVSSLPVPESTPAPAAAPTQVPQTAPEPPQPVQPEPPAPQHPHVVSGQGRRGFVVMASFGIRPNFTPQLSAGAVSTDMSSSLQGGLGIGFKVNRVVFTVGLDIGAIDIRDTFTYRTTATFLIVPGLQVSLARSRDQRVELVGSLRVGAGSTMTSEGTSTSKAPTLVMYEIAPAVRYWAHRQFAVQFLAGYGGEYQITSGSIGNTSTGRHSLAASIGTIGIF